MVIYIYIYREREGERERERVSEVARPPLAGSRRHQSPRSTFRALAFLKALFLRLEFRV